MSRAPSGTSDRRSVQRMERKRASNAAKTFFAVLSGGTRVRFKARGSEYEATVSAVGDDRVELLDVHELQPNARGDLFGTGSVMYADVEPGSMEVVKPC